MTVVDRINRFGFRFFIFYKTCFQVLSKPKTEPIIYVHPSVNIGFFFFFFFSKK
ncbi:hypothetical protein Hanom_Chr00s062332g01785541 [Helianthus anomalus]